jgi:uncharacterized protein YjbI with pentapeptide repeats
VKAGSGASWLVVITLLALAGGLVIYSYTDWPGAPYLGIADKKFWDYLELLIVPAALAFGVYWLNRTQDIRQQEADELQQNRTLETVTQQAQDAALQAYLDQMSQLMLREGLVSAKPGGEHVGENTLALARARTLTVLPTLDANRKRSVLQFLHEAGLIDKDVPIVGLTGADLRGIDLHGADLRDADLRDAYVGGADLRGADLSWANLRGADLTLAILSEADLTMALLYGTDLSEADLRDADLRDANLGDAKGITNEQLSAAYSLEGATMPDGQTLRGPGMPNKPTLEEWLKDKKAREEGE